MPSLRSTIKTGKTRIEFSIKEDEATTIFATSFVNVIMQHNLYNTIRQTKQDHKAYLVAFTGNRRGGGGQV